MISCTVFDCLPFPKLELFGASGQKLLTRTGINKSSDTVTSKFALVRQANLSVAECRVTIVGTDFMYSAFHLVKHPPAPVAIPYTSKAEKNSVKTVIHIIILIHMLIWNFV